MFLVIRDPPNVVVVRSPWLAEPLDWRHWWWYNFLLPSVVLISCGWSCTLCLIVSLSLVRWAWSCALTISLASRLTRGSHY